MGTNSLLVRSFKSPKDLQVTLNVALDETPDEEVASRTPLNPETLRQIIPKSCAI